MTYFSCICFCFGYKSCNPSKSYETLLEPSAKDSGYGFKPAQLHAINQ